MKGQVSTIEATRRAIHVLADHGITGENVLQLARDNKIPVRLLPEVRLVHGKTASMRKALARINAQS